MNKQTALVEAISITNEILEVLDEQDFLRINELEAIRQPLIRKVFEQSLDQIDRIKAHHLQDLNQRVVGRLVELKQEVLQQQQQIRLASKATNAYSSHSSAGIKTQSFG
ncbi:MAG: hypothetical protein GY820_36160 [Gammaproteobacteria bacterium]|nr:hypothetical protein [Gammaproteobacteria bacterium]